MRNFQDKHKWKHILESKTVLALLFIIVLIFAWSVFGFWWKMSETSKNKKLAEEKVAELQKQKDKLTSDISELKTSEGVEANIRDKFGLAKDGEGLIVIVDDKKQDTDGQASTGGFWSFFTNWFK